jgi:hypothetical protein
MLGAPGRTRTGSLLFRRWLNADAVPGCEVAGRLRATNESYRVFGPSRFVTLSSEKASAAIGHIHRTVDVRSQQAAHSLAGGYQGGPFTLGPAQDLGVPLDGHSRPLCPLVAPSESGVGAPQGALRAMGSSACRRVLAGLRLAPPPAVASAEPGCHSPCPAALPAVVLCRISQDVSESRLEITSSAAAGVHGRARRCCAQPMVHKRPNAPNYALNLPRVHRPDSIGQDRSRSHVRTE